MSEINKDMIDAIDEARADEEARMTCEQVFSLADPYKDVKRDGKYEEIRKDYVAISEIWDNLQNRISALKAEMADVEAEMQSKHHVLIPQELFTKHYAVCRDLHHAVGMEAAVLLRKASSGVLFLEEINREPLN